ncbi:LysR family transcriptional regulator [Bacillus cereus]|uniref:LysR family transcriptional regulator n=1 Tax=Bacillus cereus TaxID=1396 RepID=UPI000BEBA3CA|nr:LysR family transcriptional regulator [Bacillus cereus]PDY77494.1 LysR family transcriptional regulator [Bacillus cereus]PFA03136.1 LysR family transcriptional regulator [Bacillus cereus]PFM34521.1 LysR family transcriptional regulator [Bacillus cereus]
MTITQLVVFVKVVETKSFTKAGEELNMTQSAVSHAIKGLESELGVILLIRDRRRGLLLSEVGKQILIHSREVLNRLRHIEQEAATASRMDVGSIRIGSFSSASLHLLPKMIAAFQLQYPKIEIMLFDGTYQEVKEWLLSRVVDIGFSSIPDSELDFIPLIKDKMVVAFPEGHPLAEHDNITLKVLANEPLIMTKLGSEEIVGNMFKEANLEPNIRFEVQDGGTIMNMVKEGLGITIGPELALPINMAGIKIREIKPTVWRTIGLSCPSIKEAPPAVKALINAASDIWDGGTGTLSHLKNTMT